MRARSGIGVVLLFLLSSRLAAADTLSELLASVPQPDEITVEGPSRPLGAGPWRLTSGVSGFSHLDVRSAGNLRVVTWTGMMRATGGLEGRLTPAVRIGAQLGAGSQFEYQMVVTADELAAIERGELPVPDPRDPSTLRPGMTVFLNEQAIGSLQLEGAWHFLRAGLELRTGTGRVLALTRLDDDRIVVRAGAVSSLMTEVGIGVGFLGVEAGLEASNTLTADRTEVWTLDLRDLRTAGILANLRDGSEMPPPDETVLHFRNERELSLYASARGVKWTVPLLSSSSDLRVVTYRDERFRVIGVSTEHGHTVTTTALYDANGDVVSGSFRVIYAGPNTQETGDLLFEAFAGRPPVRYERHALSRAPRFEVELDADAVRALIARAQSHRDDLGHAGRFWRPLADGLLSTAFLAVPGAFIQEARGEVVRGRGMLPGTLRFTGLPQVDAPVTIDALAVQGLAILRRDQSVATAPDGAPNAGYAQGAGMLRD